MNLNINSLIQAGGKEWQSNGYHRVYFNNLAELYGLECSYYKTGNISSATLNGESISNSQARKLSSGLAFGKVWFDLKDGEFHTKDLGPQTSEKLIGAIKTRIQSLEVVAEEKIKIDRCTVMARAWHTAKEAAARFGGSSREYFAEALRLAWAEEKLWAERTRASKARVAINQF